MRFATYLLNRQPLISVLITIFLFLIAAGILRRPFLSVVDSQSTADNLAKLSVAILLGLFLVRSRSYRVPGIALPMGQWREGWWRPMLVMAPCAFPRFLTDQVNWHALQFSARHAFDWLVWMSSAGFSEEVLFRGACFGILYRAWGTTCSGRQRAAVTSALLFGVLHLMSLTNRDLTYVLYQVCFASLIGYAFAGLVAYTRSLWPAIVLHAGINGLSGIDNYFAGPDYVFRPDTHLVLIVVVGTFFVFGAIPGYWCLRRAPLSNDRTMHG